MSYQRENFRCSIEWLMEDNGAPCSLREADEFLSKVRQFFEQAKPPFNIRVTGHSIQAKAGT